MSGTGAGKDVAAWLALLVAAVGLVGTGAWNFQVDKISERDRKIADKDEQIAALRESGSWSLPATIKSMKEASDEIRSSLASRAEIEALGSEKQRLQQENLDLTAKLKVSASDLAVQKAELQMLKTQLEGAAKHPVTVELAEGQSEDVIPGIAALAATTIYSRSQVIGTLGGQSFKMDAGDRAKFRIAGLDCNLYVRTIAISSAVMSVSCNG